MKDITALSATSMTSSKRSTRCARTLTSCVLIAVGIVIGVLVNYYVHLFEAIHVQIQVSSADVGNTTAVLRSLRVPVGYLGNVTSLLVVPNVVHFVWLATNGDKQLKFLNYISFLSAYRIQRPDVIMLHCNYLPAGPWWQRLWKQVPLKIVHLEPPSYIHDQRLYHIYHRGDVAKMQILLEYGGIYLDYDVIVVNRLDPIRRYDATLGKEKPPKFIAGIIAARKGSTFLRLLYESYRDNYRPWDWDYNCARVAYQLYLKRPDLLHIEPYRLTTPDWKDRHLLWNQIIDWSDLYVIHVMGHFVYEQFTPENIRTLNSTFGQVMRYIYYNTSSIVTDL